MNYDDVMKKAAEYQVLPPPGPLRLTAWEDTGVTRSALLHKADDISSPCCAVVHGLRRRWLTLRSECATRDRDMQDNSEHASSRRLGAGELATILIC